jgi:transketolase
MITELSDEQVKDLELKANQARQLLITTLVQAGSGHSAGPLGMADIFTAFYFHILNHQPKNPDWEDRDRLVLSNGHICPIRYVSMAQAGYFPISELKTLRQIDSRLQGHPHRTVLPGVETTSGPLGEGISQAIGIALAGRMDDKKYYTYCVASDGEHQEGNTWEAIMLAGKLKLHRLIVVIDRNNIQIDGTTEDIMPLEPFADKYRAFNWHVLEVDGHNVHSFIDAVKEAHAVSEKPTVIIAHTIPGKGVEYMEGDYRWHGNPPDIANVPGSPPKGEQAKVALKELRTLQGKIKSETD